MTGGKWTTYRKMAEDVVEKVYELDPDLNKRRVDCKTWGLKLIGAHGWSLALPTTLIRQGYAEDIAQHLANNYGDKALRVTQIAKKHELKNRLVKGYPFIEAEVVYAVRHEYALTVADVLARRLRLAFLNSDAATKVLPRVLDLMSSELGWTAEQRSREMQDGLRYLETMNRIGRVERPESDSSDS
jgi:glycerol-3-phosphate dehydrogenase